MNTWISLGLLLPLLDTPNPVPEPKPEVIRKAVEKSLPLLVKGAEGHIAQRSCFGCHNQSPAMLTFALARDKGYAVTAETVEKQSKHIVEFLDGNKANYLKGKGQGGAADTAGYALATLHWGGWKADETTAAVVEYLLQYQKDLGPWKTGANRPPSEISAFTTTFVALRSLQRYGTENQRERINKRTEAARAWLLKTPAKDNEDRVFRLLALKEAGADSKAIQSAAQDLLKTQRKDGGWGQLDKMESDAYATGTALVALHQSGGVATSDDAYRRGLTYLLKTQRDDGSWFVKSRSNPFQKYYESGFPHGKDQFISMSASGWATAALVLGSAGTTTVPK